ncbi:MAG: hypothetical protein J0H82_30480 [Alphaproteobacteria bacterium]|jgi:hypothetical protein|nr:hypothetical protein [Alphaproteobacteria bacterium]
MECTIYLGIGNLELAWNKLWNTSTYSDLFQPQDRQLITYHYWDGCEEDIRSEQKVGYSRKLRDMVPRLEMLGYTPARAKHVYEVLSERPTSSDYEDPLDFEKISAAIINADVNFGTAKYRIDYNFGEFFQYEIAPRVFVGDFARDVRDTREIAENFSAEWILSLLALNPKNLDLMVEWRFMDVVEQGIDTEESVTSPLSLSNQILVVTEGSSDSHIIQRALKLLRPNTSDFYRFIDMNEGYPFSGTGNLYKFCQGLVKIGISVWVLVIYDNDTEGCNKYLQTKKLPLPNNMMVMRLPDLRRLSYMPTLGPQGETIEDINGRAAAIECYLDLNYKMREKPKVRWTSFDKSSERYQGELVQKEQYTSKFMKAKLHGSGYDFSGIAAVLYEMENVLRQRYPPEEA